MFSRAGRQFFHTIRLRLADERGLTLIEVMFTALIVVLLSAATATALIATSQASGNEQYRSEADALASQDQDQLRGLSDQQLNALQDGSQTRKHQETLGGITYTIVSGATFSDASGNANCSASAAAFYEIVSTVEWSDGQDEAISEHSLLTRPVIGDVVVKATDQSGNTLQGVSVTATGPSTQSALTNSSGCALFAGLTPGNYAFLYSDPGYVDVNGNPAPSASVAVPSGGTQAPVTLGEVSGPIGVTFKSSAGTGGEADGLSWDATGMTTPGISTSTTATTATSSSSLYPTTYAVWGGQCTAEEPALPAGAPASVTVPAGGSVNATVTEPPLVLSKVNYTSTTTTTNVTTTTTTTITRGHTTINTTPKTTTTTSTTTAPVKPADVVLTVVGTGCANGTADSWAATVASASGTTAPTGGWLANPGQPYAPTLTICADYYDPTAKAYYEGTSTATNTTFSTNISSAPTVTVGISKGTSSTGQCQT